MPRWVRILLSGWSFFLFFVGSPLIGILLFPVLRLLSESREEHRRRCTRILAGGFRIFTGWMSLARLIEPPPVVVLPESVEPGEPYVLVTNHPSLIDVILLLASFEGLTCVVKGSWYRSLVLGPLLRSANYLPGPGSGEEESEDMLGTMVEHLRAGHPLLVFPEGTRSLADRLHRFRRGAVEAAIRAKVPIVAMFVAIDRPFLMKGRAWWDVPRSKAHYSIELLEVIDTTQLQAEDARAINQRLQTRFAARFEQLLAGRGERPSGPDHDPREASHAAA
jgi:1-acyl-sn-glycerol-3-phosphate acyltransferase